MKNIYNIKSNEVWWAASDVGWVVGHSFSTYGPLLNKSTTVLYEGKPIGTPDAGMYWNIINKYNIKAMFTAPTAIRAIKRIDPNGEFIKKYNISSLQTLFLAGERADPATIKWAEKHLHIPVLDHWWQTESGWPIAAPKVGLEGYIPIKYGSSFRAVNGWNLKIFDNEDNIEITTPGTMGRIAIQLPTPPGFMLTLFNNDKRFIESYMNDIPNYYNTGDAGIIDDDVFY